MVKGKGLEKGKEKEMVKVAAKGLAKERENLTSATLETANRQRTATKRKRESATTGPGEMVIASMGQIATTDMMGHKVARKETQTRQHSLPLGEPKSPARSLSRCS
jgi:hypothetical protein